MHIWPLEATAECEACADMGKWLLTVRDSYSELIRSWVGSQEDWRVWRMAVCRRWERR